MTTRVHPGAWWLWAIGLAIAASRTTNPLILSVLLVIVLVMVAERSDGGKQARSMWFFIRLAIAVVVIRVIIQVLFGASIGQTTIVALPSLDIPALFAGVRIGGAITLESLLAAVYDGLRLATIIVCLGAANALANPTRLLKSVPAALYEIGVTVVVAMSFTPQLVADVERVRVAQRLRGRRTRGVRAFTSSAIPVFESALDRSITLAAAMDSRGYGRHGNRSTMQRRMSSALLLVALIAVIVALYTLLTPEIPSFFGWSLLLLATVSGGVAIAYASTHRIRSVYRPSPWTWRSWLVSGAGIGCAGLVIAGSLTDASSFTSVTSSAAWPTFPWLGIAASLLAVSPLFVTMRSRS